MRITIDEQKCMGSANCTFWAPSTFDVGPEDVAVVLDPAGDPEDKIRLAADGCPTGAIALDGRD
jgi:ferredoxin